MTSERARCYSAQDLKKHDLLRDWRVVVDSYAV
jgi:hypothetical protein